MRIRANIVVTSSFQSLLRLMFGVRGTSRRRTSAPVAAILAAVVVATLVPGVAQAHDWEKTDPSGAQLKVTPDGYDGDALGTLQANVVQVDGKGFKSLGVAQVFQCKAGETGPLHTRCQSVGTAPTGTAGVFSTSVNITYGFYRADQTFQSCTPSGDNPMNNQCSVIAATFVPGSNPPVVTYKAEHYFCMSGGWTPLPNTKCTPGPKDGDPPPTTTTTSSTTTTTLPPTIPTVPKPPDSWETGLPDLFSPAVTPTATATGGIGSDQRVYLMRGGSGGEAYDLNTRTWTALPVTSMANRAGPATVTGSRDGRIYLIGGSENTNAIYTSVGVPSAIVEAYDRATNAWTRLPDLDNPRTGATAASDRLGRIYAIGGTTTAHSTNYPGGQGFDKTVERFDPADPARGWEPVANMLTARPSNPAAATGSDGRIYVLGGTGDGSTMEAYDPDSGTWSVEAPIATPRGNAYYGVTAGADGRIYAIGGYASGPMVRTEVYDPATKVWTPVAPMPTARYQLAAALGADGRIYAMGGYGNDFSSRQKVEAYTPGPAPPPPPPDGDQGPDSWKRVANMSAGRAFFAATTGLDGRVYAVGGGTLGAEVYDPATDVWTVLPPTTGPRQYAAVATGKDGRIYAFAGGDGYTPSNTAEAYDPALNVWVPVPPMPANHNGGAAATGPDGRIYVMGGYNASTGQITQVDVYNVDSGLWEAAAPMPAPRANIGAAVGADGRIYVAGGEPDNSRVDAYDYKTNTWTTVAPLPRARNNVALSAGPDGRIYAVGGLSSMAANSNPLNSMDVYEPAGNRWAPAAPMADYRRGGGVALGGDGRIYAMGGMDRNGNYLATAEAYVPGPMPPPEENKPIVPIVNGPINEYRMENRDVISVTNGPDGNVWFTLANAIGRMTPDAVVTYFPFGSVSAYSTITAGPDGNLWFTMPSINKIGRITPGGDITEFALPSEFPAVPWYGTGPRSITAAPDGNLWFTHPTSKRIGRITPAGVVSSYPVPSDPPPVTAPPRPPPVPRLRRRPRRALVTATSPRSPPAPTATCGSPRPTASPGSHRPARSLSSGSALPATSSPARVATCGSPRGMTWAISRPRPPTPRPRCAGSS